MDYHICRYAWCILAILCLMNYFWAMMLIQSGISKCKMSKDVYETEWEDEMEMKEGENIENQEEEGASHRDRKDGGITKNT